MLNSTALGTPLTNDARLWRSDTFRCRIETFVKQVDEGVAPAQINGSGKDGLEAQRVIHAAIKSLDEGRIVEVAEI